MGGSEPVESQAVERTREARPGEWALLGGLSFLMFAAHMLVSGRYGYFVDELYYLACSHHLAWGYVDQPPLIAVITWLERVTLGDSFTALRFLPAVAAGLRVLLTGLIARELGARRFGMLLACVCVMVAPIYLGLDSLLTMNVFESLFWMGAALIVLKIFNGASPKLWLCVWPGVRRGLVEQAFDAVLRICIGYGASADDATPPICVAVAVAGRFDRAADFLAEPDLGN